MTSDESDLTLRMLSRLPAAEPDPRRAERVRLRCHAVARRNAAVVRRRSSVQRTPVLTVGTLTLAYLAAAIHDLMRWYEMR